MVLGHHSQFHWSRRLTWLRVVLGESTYCPPLVPGVPGWGAPGLFISGVVIISQFALLIIAHPLIRRLGWVLLGADWPNPLWMTSQSSLWLLLAQLWLWFLVHSSRLTILAYTTWLRFLSCSAQSSTPARLAQSESPTCAAWLRSPGCLGLF